MSIILPRDVFVLLGRLRSGYTGLLLLITLAAVSHPLVSAAFLFSSLVTLPSAPPPSPGSEGWPVYRLPVDRGDGRPFGRRVYRSLPVDRNEPTTAADRTRMRERGDRQEPCAPHLRLVKRSSSSLLCRGVGFQGFSGVETCKLACSLKFGQQSSSLS